MRCLKPSRTLRLSASARPRVRSHAVMMSAYDPQCHWRCQNRTYSGSGAGHGKGTASSNSHGGCGGVSRSSRSSTRLRNAPGRARASSVSSQDSYATSVSEVLSPPDAGRNVIRSLVASLSTDRLDRVLVFLELAAAESKTENRTRLVRRFRQKVGGDSVVTEQFDRYLRGGATEPLLERTVGAEGSASSSSSSSSSALKAHEDEAWQQYGNETDAADVLSSGGVGGMGVSGAVTTQRLSELLLAVRSAAPRHFGAYRRAPPHLRLHHVFENLRDDSVDVADQLAAHLGVSADAFGLYKPPPPLPPKETATPARAAELADALSGALPPSVLSDFAAVLEAAVTKPPWSRKRSAPTQEKLRLENFERLSVALGHHWTTHYDSLLPFLKIYDESAVEACPFREKYAAYVKELEERMLLPLSIIRSKYVTLAIKDVADPLTTPALMRPRWQDDDEDDEEEEEGDDDDDDESHGRKRNARTPSADVLLVDVVDELDSSFGTDGSGGGGSAADDGHASLFSESSSSLSPASLSLSPLALSRTGHAIIDGRNATPDLVYGMAAPGEHHLDGRGGSGHGMAEGQRQKEGGRGGGMEAEEEEGEEEEERLLRGGRKIVRELAEADATVVAKQSREDNPYYQPSAKQNRLKVTMVVHAEEDSLVDLRRRYAFFGKASGGGGGAGRVVMVRNLPPRTGELDLIEALAPCGGVLAVRLFNRYRSGETEEKVLRSDASPAVSSAASSFGSFESVPSTAKMAVTREVEAVIARHRTADNKRKGGDGKGGSGGSGQDLDDGTGDGFTYGSDLHDVIQGGYIDEDQGEDGGVEDMIVELGADRLPPSSNVGGASGGRGGVEEEAAITEEPIMFGHGRYNVKGPTVRLDTPNLKNPPEGGADKGTKPGRPAGLKSVMAARNRMRRRETDVYGRFGYCA